MEINGVTISYEKKGSGDPILFVHGNGEDHRIFNRTVEILKKHFACYLIDSRGHGKSSRVAELHYRDMAEDMILFMERLKLDNVTFVGFSDGGIIGLMAAAKTKRITGLITCGANMRPEGLKPLFMLPLRFINLFRRDPMITMMLREPDLTYEELGKIQARTLVIAGSNDVIKRSETDCIAKAVPGAKELVLRGETHTSYVVCSRKLGRIILDFMKK